MFDQSGFGNAQMLAPLHATVEMAATFGGPGKASHGQFSDVSSIGLNLAELAVVFPSTE